jgi:L-asparaginase
VPSTSLLATGGTIAWNDIEERMMSAEELASVSRVHFDSTKDVATVPSYDLDVNAMLEVVLAIRNEIEGGATGVVVTHGTDTVEETAWLAQMLLKNMTLNEARVVFTGSMKFFGTPEADGPANLSGALALANGSEEASGGVVVHFAGKNHVPRGLRKVSANEVDPFVDLLGGSIPVPPIAQFPRRLSEVALVKVGPIGPNVIPPGFAGYVLEGTGASHIPSRLLLRVDELLAKNTPVVVASRCSDVDRSGWQMDEAFFACDLTPEKAALALAVGLSTTTGMSSLRTWWRDLVGI